MGLFAIAGGLVARELPGRELAGVDSLDVSTVFAAFFHGAAVPFAGIIPGNTETGLAFTFAARDFTGVGACLAAVPAAGGGGWGRRAGGGGGGGAALFGGTNSR